MQMGATFRPLAAGLAGMGHLPDEFGFRQIQILIADRCFPQLIPSVKKQLQRQFRAIRSSGGMHHERRLPGSARMMQAHVVGNPVFLAQPAE